uniref:uncharacterized protein LOC120336905 isoform X1 n=1 Tax=Styela clava TaxID=7725 RepID=UPI0019392D7B|nr:uncharacterized protein LOC120336905 isoform X1 [Styela clava]
MRMNNTENYQYTGNYGDDIMRGNEEANPLTWQRELNSGNIASSHDGEKNNDVTINKKTNCEHLKRHRMVTSAWTKKSRRKPTIVILVIAFVFFILLASALIVNLYFKMKEYSNVNREYPGVDVTEPTLISTSTASSTNIYATPSVVNSTSAYTTVPATVIPTGLKVPQVPYSATTYTYTTSEGQTSPLAISNSYLETAPSLTTRIIQYSTKTTPSPTTFDVTTQYGEFTTIVEKTPTSVPIFYMSGPFTFHEAIEACEREGTKLALKEDIDQAWKGGYNRCTFGWLRDMHIGMIIQQEYASIDCEKGAVGAIYKPPREPINKYSGAYCTKGNLNNPGMKSMSVGSNANKTVNWWVTNDPADIYNLRHTLMIAKSNDDSSRFPLMMSLKSVYTCCNFFNITYNNVGGSSTPFVKQRYSVEYFKTLVEMYHREFASVRVLTHVTAKYDAMMKYGAATTNRHEIISSLVNKAKNLKLDGLILDYEPRESYSREHAVTYRIFLDDLASELSKYNMSLGTVVSSWGILKYYDIFANSKVNFIGSMSSTYYGHNTDSNKQHVLDMMKEIDTDRLEIGLGLMYNDQVLPKPKRNYRWSEERLEDFIRWSDNQGIRRVHVYPGQWRSHKASEKYFLRTLSNFSEGKS